MKRIVEIIIDLQNKIYNTIFLKQMDTTEIKVKLLNNNIVANLEGQTVDIIFTKPDNSIVQQLSSKIDETDGIAIIPLLKDCLRQAGKAKMEIEVKNTNNEVITSFYIPVQIEKTSKENVTSENTPNYFEEFVKAVDDFKEESTEMLEEIANAEAERASNYNKFINIMQQLETPPPETGENITLNDCKAGKFKSFDIRGNSEQEEEPSSSNEAPIKSCGDNINYFVLPDNGTQNGVTFTINTDGTFDLVGTATANVNLGKYIDKEELELIENEDYVLSGDPFNSNVYAKIDEFNDSTYIRTTYNLMTSSENTEKYQPNSQMTKIRFTIFVKSGTTVNIKNAKVKFEKGKVASPYSKFGQGNINIDVSNKNLVVIEQGSLNLNTGEETNYAGYYRSKFIKVTNNKTISTNFETNGPDKQIIVLEYDKNRKFLRQSTYNALKCTSTIGNNTEYIRTRYYVGPNNTISNVILNIGNEESYIPREEQTLTISTQKPFGSIGDIRDHFVKQGGKRYEYHTIKRVILDGTESYTITNNLDNWIQFRQNVVNSIKENTELMCNYFKYADANTVYSDKLEAITVDTNNRFRISFLNNTEITTVEQFKAWLAQKYAEGHPVYIDYVLAEPEKLLCTDEQNAVLSDLEELETYDDCTHIYSADEVAPNFEVTYCKDVQKLFNNIAI